jgi:hypothetical protein
MGDTVEKKLGENQKAYLEMIEIYKKYQDNIRVSETLQSEIAKGVKNGEDVHSLFLKAVKAISLMTGTSLYYEMIEQSVKDIYGFGLLHEAPLSIELEEIRSRLYKLREAEQREPNNENIKAAIRAHIERENRIIELLK